LDIEKRPNEPIHFRTRIDVDELEGPPPRYWEGADHALSDNILDCTE
jgi:hypothetical protein